MGAADFMVYVAKSDSIADADAAFRHAVSEARWERGNGGYTGTIGEKGGYRSVSQALPRRAAEAHAAARIEAGMDKWGDAECIRVIEQPVKTRTLVSRFLSIDHEDPVERVNPPDPVVLAALKLRDDEQLIKLVTLDEQRRYRVRPKRHSGPATRVFVAEIGRRRREFASRDEAIAAVTAELERGLDPDDPSVWRFRSRLAGAINIVEEVRRGGECSVSVVRELVSRKVKLEATVEAAAGPPGAVVGWLFYGMASC